MEWTGPYPVEQDRKRYADDITLQELVRLRVENERLREVLKPFAEIANDWDHLDDGDYVSVHRYDIELRHFRAIRSALGVDP